MAPQLTFLLILVALESVVRAGDIYRIDPWEIYGTKPPPPTYRPPTVKTPWTPYNKELLKKGLLDIEPTLAMCRRYRELQQFGACKAAMRPRREGEQKIDCPLAGYQVWRDGDETPTPQRRKRMINPCTGDWISVAAMRGTGTDGKTYDLVHCIEEAKIQVFKTNCPTGEDVIRGFCGMQCHDHPLRIIAPVYINDFSEEYEIREVTLPLTCCLM